MKLRIIWTGKTKERYAAEGIHKYLKLLKPMAQVEILEIKEQKSGGMEERIEKEGEKVLKQTSSYVLLDERGHERTSMEFADWLKDKSQVDFLIGGAYGVSDEVRSKASETMCLSQMTLTHEMARVMLLEQLYRAMTIMKGGGYHH